MTYDEKFPVLSFRVENKLKGVTDSFLETRKESRNEYFKSLLVSDLEKRGIIKIDYKVEDSYLQED